MRAEYHRFGRGWFWALAGLALGAISHTHALAQSAAIPSQPSESSAALATFQQERQTLVQELQTLISQGVTRQQLQAWQQQNAPQFAALQQLTQQMNQSSALQARPLIQNITIPAGASSTFQEFLITEAGLANARAQIHNQQLQNLPSSPTSADIGGMQQQERQIFIQQYATDLQLQRQRAQALAASSASRPAVIPGPTVIPPNATPQLQAYLNARDNLIRDRAQLANQYLGADSAARRAAIKQWYQQNAGPIQQLRQLAQNLSNATPIQEGQTQ